MDFHLKPRRVAWRSLFASCQNRQRQTILPNEKNMTVIEYVSILEKESQELSALSGKLSEIELFKQICLRSSYPLFWELCKQYGLDFVLELQAELVKKHNIDKFNQYTVNLSSETLSDIPTCYPAVPGRKTIDYLIEKNNGKHPEMGVIGMLSQYQSLDAIEYAFTRLNRIPGSDEFLSTLLAEVILRQHIADNINFKKHFEIHLKDKWLKSLPIKLLAAEKSFPIVTYSYSGGCGYNTIHFDDILSKEIEIDIRHASATEEIVNDQAFGFALQDWVSSSNGHSIEKIYQLEGPEQDDVSLLASVLKSMNQSFEEECDSYRVKQLSPSDTIAILGQAATFGGAYSRIMPFKRARLETWKTYSALTGKTINFLVENDNKDIPDVSMYLVSPENDWFWQLAWDLFIIVIDRSANLARVLAATDTD